MWKNRLNRLKRKFAQWICLIKKDKINGNDCIVNKIFRNALTRPEFTFYRVKLNTCMNTDSRMFDETPILFVSKLLDFLCRVILPETAGSALDWPCAGPWDSLLVSLRCLFLHEAVREKKLNQLDKLLLVSCCEFEGLLFVEMTNDGLSQTVRLS